MHEFKSLGRTPESTSAPHRRPDARGSGGRAPQRRRCAAPPQAPQPSGDRAGGFAYQASIAPLSSTMSASAILAAGHTDSVLACTVLPGPKLLASGGEVGRP